MSTFTKTDVAALLNYLERICRYSDHTLRSYRTSLGQYGTFLRARHKCARSASFDDVLEFAATLHNSKPATARTRLAAVKALHRYLHAMGHVERNVAQLVPSPRRQRGLRPAHGAQAVQRVRAELETHRDRALFGLMYDSMVRIDEARTLLVDDVNLEFREATVLGKGNKLRTVSIDVHTAAELAAWLPLRHRADSPYLFPSYRPGHDGPISVRPIYGMLEGAVKRAAVGGHWTPHALRRSMSRHLAEAGASPFAIQDEMGHESLRMTSEYVRAGQPTNLPDALRDRVRELALRDTPTIVDVIREP